MKLKKLILTVMVFIFSVISFSAENDDVYEQAVERLKAYQEIPEVSKVELG